MSKILIANSQISSSDAFSLTRGTTDVLTISGSYVGIGTTNPYNALTINPGTAVSWGEGIVITEADNEYCNVYFRSGSDPAVTTDG